METKIVRTIPMVLSRSERFLTHINIRVVSGCGILLFLQMFFQVCDVAGRYLFSMPLPGTMEISESVLVFITFLCAANVLARGGHIRVTILIDRLSPTQRLWADLFCFLVGFSITLLIAWRAFLYGLYSYKVHDTAGTGTAFDLPLYPAKFAFFVGIAMLSLQFFIQMLNSFFGIVTKSKRVSREKENGL